MFLVPEDPIAKNEMLLLHLKILLFSNSFVIKKKKKKPLEGNMLHLIIIFKYGVKKQILSLQMDLL